MPLPSSATADEAQRQLDQAIVLRYRCGWQPAEVVRHVGLTEGPAAIDLSRWLVAADHRGRPTAVVDPRWQTQLDELDLPTVGDDGPWLRHWVRAHGGTREADLSVVQQLLLLLGTMPMLPVLLPPPGLDPYSKVIGGSGTAATGADPVLVRVRALLAKAESTEHEAEATAFTAKAQELITRHAIDRATLDGASSSGGGIDPGRPSAVRIPVDPPYGNPKSLLLHVVAEHSRCQALFHGRTTQLSTVIGYPTDLESVELLFTSLLVQAQRALGEAATTAPAGSRPRTRGFRSAFLIGFSHRIGERLAEVNRLAYADERAGTFLPVLRSQEERIAAFVSQEFGPMRTTRIRGGQDWAGYHSGTVAGDAAKLASGVIGS